ncbi:ribonuclease T2 family protein [Flaviflagellibacter deserti]|uniref:Ribonuclease T n=1 Tax=Flaviflagellibacter deserti TaxID=2267266 RepID=A0ABV9Z1J1_9HYPH
MRFIWKTLAFGALIAATTVQGAYADVSMSGQFTAERACPAFQSFRRATNPGNIRVEPGQIYALVAKNREDATHYRLRVDGALPIERWVEAGCGVVSSDDDGPVTPNAPLAEGSGEFLLAISWQPSFCETRSQKTECRSQTADRPDATNFTLHGLWPQPRNRVYCNVPSDLISEDNASRWDELPAPQLAPDTRQALDVVMPGTMSMLDRHEWIKHGTCYGTDADTYFADSIRIVREINGSKAQQLFASRIGQKVTSAELRAAFDESFGTGAGERVTMQCKRDGGRLLISEIKVGLIGNPSAGTSVNDLIAAARPVLPECSEGIVDPVGLQ